MYSGIAKILLSFTPGLIKKTRATYLTDEMQNKSQSRVGHWGPPALEVLIGFLFVYYLYQLLWLIWFCFLKA